MQIKTKILSCHTADSKLVKQEVNGIVILPPLVFFGIPYGHIRLGLPLLRKANVLTKSWGIIQLFTAVKIHYSNKLEESLPLLFTSTIV